MLSNKSSNCLNTPPFQEKLLIIVFYRIRTPEMKLVNFVRIIRVITVSIFLLNFFLPLILLTNSVQTLHFSVVTTFFVPSFSVLQSSHDIVWGSQWRSHCHFWKVAHLTCCILVLSALPCVLHLLFMPKQPRAIDGGNGRSHLPTTHTCSQSL